MTGYKREGRGGGGRMVMHSTAPHAFNAQDGGRDYSALIFRLNSNRSGQTKSTAL